MDFSNDNVCQIWAQCWKRHKKLKEKSVSEAKEAESPLRMRTIQIPGLEATITLKPCIETLWIQLNVGRRAEMGLVYPARCIRNARAELFHCVAMKLFQDAAIE